MTGLEYDRIFGDALAGKAGSAVLLHSQAKALYDALCVFGVPVGGEQDAENPYYTILRYGEGWLPEAQPPIE